MSGLIKSRDAGAGHRVRALSNARRPSEPATGLDPVAAELDALRREIQMLSGELALRDAEVSRLADANALAFDEGKAAGRQIGLKEADARGAEAMARLEVGVRGALKRLDQEVEGLERLAVVLAREGLARIIGNADGRTELLSLAIRKQVEQLRSQAIVAVQVARSEFPLASDLEDLAAAIGRKEVFIEATDDLRAGDCRIKLKLGGLEVGLNQQWAHLDLALDRLAAPGAAP